jgi:ABC-type nitrate/sulfonate/bicarbonate transport system permease component
MNASDRLLHAARGATGGAMRSLGFTALGLLGFLAIWHWASSALNPVLLPRPAAVLDAYRELVADGSLAKDMAASLRRVFGGFAIAAAIAPPLALVLASSWTLRCIMLPLVTLLRPIPPIAWIPLAILWFGLGDPPSYFITALAAFFPIFLNAFAGGQQLEREHVNAARSLGAGPTSLLLRIMLPSALPSIATGLRIGLGQAWMAVVTAELVAAQSGLGFMIQASRLNLETSRVLVGMTLIGILGAIMTTVLGIIERRLIVPWNHAK